MLCFVLLVVGLVYYSGADVQISGSAMICSRVKTLTFDSEVNLRRYAGRMVSSHQWNQVYTADRDHFITRLGSLATQNSKFTIDLETFDNNTEVYNLYQVHNASDGGHLVMNLTLYGSGFERRFIYLVDDGYYNHRRRYIKQEYNMKNNKISFSCRKYCNEHVQIGWINTAGDKLFYYPTIETELALTAEHDGSMLCCVYYKATVNENEINIRRHVEDKILFIYKEEIAVKDTPRDTITKQYCEKSNTSKNSVDFSPEINERKSNAAKAMDENSKTPQETGNSSNTTKETDKNFNETKETGKSTNAPNELDDKPNATKEMDKNFNDTNGTDTNSKVTNETDTNSIVTNETDTKSNVTHGADTKSNATNITESSPPNKTPDQDVVPSKNSAIVISAICASLLLLLVLVAVLYKRYRRDVTRRNTAQRPLPPVPRQRSSDEPDPNSPFYLNLLFRRECQREIQAREEAHYEEVIYQ